MKPSSLTFNIPREEPNQDLRLEIGTSNVLLDSGNGNMIAMDLHAAHNLAQAIEAGLNMLHPNGFAVPHEEKPVDAAEPPMKGTSTGNDSLPKTQLITDEEREWMKENPYFGFLVRHENKDRFLTANDMQHERRIFTGDKGNAHIFPTRYAATRFTQGVPSGATVLKVETSYILTFKESENARICYLDKNSTETPLKVRAATYPYDEAITILARLEHTFPNLKMERVLA